MGSPLNAVLGRGGRSQIMAPSGGPLFATPQELVRVSHAVQRSLSGSDGDTIFAMTPDDPNNGGTLFYGFNTKYGTIGNGYRYQGVDQPDGSGPSWSLSHDATGNYDGSGCPLITCLEGWDQMNFGWQLSGLTSPALGTSWYVRWRVKYHTNFLWRHWNASIPTAIVNKFIMVGSNGVDRVIIHMTGPSGSYAGCYLGGADNSYNRPSDFGITVSPDTWWDNVETEGLYGANIVHQNIGSFPEQLCAGPVLQERGIWYHCQARIQGGLSEDAEFELWQNNNDQDNPDYQKIGGTDFNQDSDTWGSTINVGGFGMNAGQDNPFWLGGFEIGLSFRDDWFPG